ncbi:MAG: hypothetical protein GEU79_11860 [Acidimicrobiia bacterium]|nr:hypothetical protein [Acidimicrobiia bacterium]
MKRTLILVICMLTLAAAVPTAAQELPPGGSFTDDNGSVHEGAIEAIYTERITTGCNAEETLFCPDDPVTRGQMAAFLVRAVEGIERRPGADAFVDDDESVFEADINGIAAAEVTFGCNPPENDRFCPDWSVTREQMATFLVKAFELADEEGPGDNPFEDVGEFNVHRENIIFLAESGITVGCNPPDNDRFCPTAPVTRGEMATFLARALGLEPIEVPPVAHMLARFTTYHDCCQPRVENIHLMADQVDDSVVEPGETYSINNEIGPRTEEKGYVPAPILVDGELVMGVGGGVSQFATTMFNAIVYSGLEEVDHQPHSIYISRYPVAVEGTLNYPNIDLAFRNDSDSPVTIETSYTDTSLTVELWGFNDYREVAGDHSASNGTHVEVLNAGGDQARVVDLDVTQTGTRSYQVDRTVDGPDGVIHDDTWHWTYRDPNEEYPGTDVAESRNP